MGTKLLTSYDSSSINAIKALIDNNELRLLIIAGRYGLICTDDYVENLILKLSMVMSINRMNLFCCFIIKVYYVGRFLVDIEGRGNPSALKELIIFTRND